MKFKDIAGIVFKLAGAILPWVSLIGIAIFPKDSLRFSFSVIMMVLGMVVQTSYIGSSAVKEISLLINKGKYS